VGAINAAYLAASHHLDAAEAAAGLLERWREVSKGEVVRPILLQQVPLTVVRYAGELLSVPGVRLPSLLDPTPLERNLRRWMDWDAAHRNLSEGEASALAVVATAARSGRTVVFVEGGVERPLHTRTSSNTSGPGSPTSTSGPRRQSRSSSRRCASRRRTRPGVGTSMAARG
jgi:NTE family protein